MPVSVRQAAREDLDALVPLFDGYRQFYHQKPDQAAARRFLAARLERQDSVLLMAEEAGRAVGFTQLYPSFSSVGMRPIYILNDLFVLPEARGIGVGGALLDAAAEYGRSQGARSLTLTTENGNIRAQAVYEAKNWVADSDFKTYHYRLDA